MRHCFKLISIVSLAAASLGSESTSACDINLESIGPTVKEAVDKIYKEPREKLRLESFERAITKIHELTEKVNACRVFYRHQARTTYEERHKWMYEYIDLVHLKSNITGGAETEALWKQGHVNLQYWGNWREAYEWYAKRHEIEL